MSIVWKKASSLGMPVTPTDLPARSESCVTVVPGAMISEFKGTGTTVATAVTGSWFSCPKNISGS